MIRARVFLTAMAVLSACTSARAFADGVEITRALMGEQWPLTVHSGALACDAGVVSFRAGGVTFAVNGSAKTYGKRLGWRDIREIWRDNPAIPGTKMDLAPLIQRGLAHCDRLKNRGNS